MNVLIGVLEFAGNGALFVLRNLGFLFVFLGSQLLVVVSDRGRILLSYFTGEGIGPKNTQITSQQQVFFFFQVFIDQFVYTIQISFRPFLIILVIILVNVVNIVGTFIILWFVWAPLFQFFLVLMRYNELVTNLVLQFAAPILNSIAEIIETFTPGWNDLWATIVSIINNFVAAICQFGPDNPNNTCIPLKTAIDFIWAEFHIIWDTLKLAFSSLGQIIQSVANSICPNGLCTAEICNILAGTPVCYLSPQLIINFITRILTFLIDYVANIVQSIVYFLLDILIFGLNILVIASSAFVNGDSLSQLLKAQIDAGSNAPSLVQSAAPPGVLRDVLLFIETFLLKTLYGILDAVKALLILVDFSVCNVFINFGTCVVPKVCFALFKPFIIAIGAIKITIDLATEICVKTLHLSLNYCACDICITYAGFIFIFQLFGLIGSGGGLPVPCNGKASCFGCTNPNSPSIYRFILPLG